MIGVFIKDGNPEIIQTAKDYLNITTLFYFFLGQIFIFRNTLQGMGQTGIPMLACTAELVMRSFAAIYLAQHMGYLGICYASPIAWIGAALIVAAGYFVTIRKMRGHYFKNQIKWIEHKLGLNKDNGVFFRKALRQNKEARNISVFFGSAPNGKNRLPAAESRQTCLQNYVSG